MTVALTVYFDMGWSKRSSSNIHDSISGHALKIDFLSDKILTTTVSSKICIAFSKAENIGEKSPDHICPKNYEGSSKVMEADAVLHLYKSMFYNSNKQLTLKAIVADDDLVIRSLLRYTSTVNKGGKLPKKILEPEWLADPSHRTKVIAKSIFHLANVSKNIRSCTKIDAIRFKKYVGYMLKTNHNRSISEISNISKVVIEHLFNCHDYCNIAWYKPLKNIKEGGKYEGSWSFYRNKSNNKNCTIRCGIAIDLSPRPPVSNNYSTISIPKRTRQ